MPIEFDITLEAKDMYRFNMYHTYTAVQGYIPVVFAIVLFMVANVAYGKGEVSYTAILVLMGGVLLADTPVRLWLHSKRSFAVSDTLRNPLHYVLDEEGIHVTQGEESAVLPWEQIYKIVSTASNVLIFSSRKVAYIVPRSQIEDKYAAIAELARHKLPKYRVRIK